MAFEPQIDYSIERAGNLKSMMFGGEGIFLATLQGAGHVWLQSLPFNRLADRVVANVRPGGSDGEGSVLGGQLPDPPLKRHLWCWQPSTTTVWSGNCPTLH